MCYSEKTDIDLDKAHRYIKVMRDFSGDVLTVFHCLVEDIEPLGEADTIYYMGCPTCKKKACDHGQSPVPLYLANVLFMTFDHKVQAKAIGSVVEVLLGISPEKCVPDADGLNEELDDALEVARSRPFNCKFIIGQYEKGHKNTLEVVHVKETVELSPKSPLTHIPSTMLKLVPSDLQGCPPCSLTDVTLENELKIVFGKPVSTIQLLVVICDTGSERGCMMKDGDLVRISRKAVCALSGVNVALQKTGELAKTSKYCKWNKGDVVYVIGRIMSYETDEKMWRISMTADRLVAKDVVGFANTYFILYHKYVGDCMNNEPILFNPSWTPKKRRTTISSESNSACTMTPKALCDTPINVTDGASV